MFGLFCYVNKYTCGWTRDYHPQRCTPHCAVPFCIVFSRLVKTHEPVTIMQRRRVNLSLVFGDNLVHNALPKTGALNYRYNLTTHTSAHDFLSIVEIFLTAVVLAPIFIHPQALFCSGFPTRAAHHGNVRVSMNHGFVPGFITPG